MNLMNKLMKKRKMNNKGFSLVELIIVIAIMAILVGIVGTQVVPYIEKSRKAKDVQIISGYSTDAMSAYSSEAANLDPDATYVITITMATAGASGSVTVTGGTSTEQTALKTAFTELNGLNPASPSIKFESKAGKDIKDIKITCKNAAPMIEVVTTNNTPAKYSFDKITTN